MPSSVYEFQWPVPTSGDGYAWVECRTDRGDTVLGLGPRADAEFTTYRPLQRGMALHRELAATEPTAEGVAAFANRYGPLGLGPGDTVRLKSGLKNTWGGAIRGELLQGWQREIIWIREAVRLWDMVQEGDADGLKQVIEWEGSGRVHYYPPPEVEEALGGERWREIPDESRRNYKGQDILGNAPNGDQLRQHVRQGDVVVPALVFVQNRINAEIWRNVGPALLWDAARKRTVSQEVPRNLLAAAYLQFAQEMLFLREPQRCQVCGRWFDLTPGAGASSRLRRSDRETCSTACRSKAYRQRQERARQLHAEGKTAREIARELGSDVKTVKGWVSKREG
jgi:hypothetical protein